MSSKVDDKLGDGSTDIITHPIQLVNIAVTEASFVAYRTGSKEDNIRSDKFALSFGHSDYYSEIKQVSVRVGVTIGKELDNSDRAEADLVEQNPFYLKLNVTGLFVVDPSRFAIEEIPKWAKRNAPYLVYPFVREHVHSLMIRFGFPGAILPLLQIPTREQSPTSPKT